MPRQLQQITLLLWLLWSASFVRAGSYTVDPTRINMNTNQKRASLTLTNVDQTPIVLQIEIKAWTQVDGNDVYSPTRDVLVTPPIVTILPGAEQIIRIGYRRPPDPKKEESYRLFVQELPTPPKPGFNGLAVALRLSLPIFVGSDKLLPKCQWGVTYLAKEHALRVILTNTGTAHLQLLEFALLTPTSDTNLVHQQLSQYLLPGQQHEWLLELLSI